MQLDDVEKDPVLSEGASQAAGRQTSPPEAPVRIFLPVKDGDGRSPRADGRELEPLPSVAEQIAEGRQIVIYRPGELPD